MKDRGTQFGADSGERIRPTGSGFYDKNGEPKARPAKTEKLPWHHPDHPNQRPSHYDLYGDDNRGFSQ